MASGGISHDTTNSKYRQFMRGDDILEYTLEGSKITVDWVSGRDVASMLKSVLDVDGANVTTIAGYVTDKLGRASEAALRRWGNQVSRKLEGRWKVSIELIEGRRYLVLTK